MPKDANPILPLRWELFFNAFQTIIVNPPSIYYLRTPQPIASITIYFHSKLLFQ